MVLDYRNTKFTFQGLKRKRRQRRIKFLLFTVLVLTVVLSGCYIYQLIVFNSIQNTMLKGHFSRGIQEIEKHESIFLSHSRCELKALGNLFEKKFAVAGTLLAGLTHSSRVNHSGFLNRMVDEARYKALDKYSAFLRKSEKNVDYYRLIYHVSQYDCQKAGDIMNRLSHSQLTAHAKAIRLLKKICAEMTLSGRIHCIHDYSGHPAGYFDVKKKRVVSLVPGLSLQDFTPVLQQGLRFFTITVDLKVQQCIHRLFSNFNGTFLIFRTRDNSMAAAYSSSPDTRPANPVFCQQYEPGSIIKAITYYAAQIFPKSLDFPLNCRGKTKIAGRLFFDWAAHGYLDTPEAALAKSCNIAFARMGIAVGTTEYNRILAKFFFNRPEFRDRFLCFNTGLSSPAPLSPLQMGNLAIGLKEISVTTFHAALIASIVAQNGSVCQPFLITGEKNILDLGIYHHETRKISQVPESRWLQKLATAMVQVVESPEGTGRRSRVEFMHTAIKTGTSGNPALGLDSVLMGYFPVKNPEYAFAFRLEKAGKAEFRGALFLKDFFNTRCWQ